MSSKRLLYVGGVADEVDERILTAAFIPFGDLLDVQIPVDQATQKHRGFGFVEFELDEDAAAAMENMNNSELYGRVLKVNIAKPVAGKNQAIWAEADQWYENLKEDAEGGEKEDNADGEEGVGLAAPSSSISAETEIQDVMMPVTTAEESSKKRSRKEMSALEEDMEATRRASGAQ